MPSFNRIHLSGTLASGAETWSTSFAVRPAGGGVTASPAELTAWAEAIMDVLELTGDIPELLTGLSSTGAITEARVYHYPGTSAPATAVGIAAGSRPGTTSPSRPTSVAAVLSLRTGLAGRRFRGRMYWPALANTINTTGRFTSTVTGNLAGQAGEILTTLAAEGPGGDVPLVSVVSAAGDLVTPVTAISVGDVPDSMRSRRDALDEVYTTVNLP